MMTGKDAALLINTEALLSTAEGLTFGVKILNVRTVWGRTDYEVEPLNGVGRRWVGSVRIKPKTV